MKNFKNSKTVSSCLKITIRLFPCFLNKIVQNIFFYKMRMTTPKRYAKKILYLFARPLMPVKLDPPRPSKGFILTPKPISELPESNTRSFF